MSQALVFGQRVKLTDKGIRMGLQGRAKTIYGTFLGYSHKGKQLKVRREGIQTFDYYSAAFWQAAD